MKHVTEGQGPVVLALHSAGMDQGQYLPWMEPLARHCRLVVPDLSQHGSHQALIEALEAFRREQELDQFVVLGHSHGAFLALDFALARPQGLRGLVLVGSAANLSHVPSILARTPLSASQQQAIHTVFASAPTSDLDLALGWREILPLYFLHAPPELVRRYGDGIRYRAAHFGALMAALDAWDVSQRLQEIQVPALVAHGAQDWLLPWELTGKRVAEGIPASQTALFTQSGHFPFVEEAERFTEVVSAWVHDLA